MFDTIWIELHWYWFMVENELSFIQGIDNWTSFSLKESHQKLQVWQMFGFQNTLLQYIYECLLILLIMIPTQALHAEVFPKQLFRPTPGNAKFPRVGFRMTNSHLCYSLVAEI